MKHSSDFTEDEHKISSAQKSYLGSDLCHHWESKGGGSTTRLSGDSLLPLPDAEEQEDGYQKEEEQDHDPDDEGQGDTLSLGLLSVIEGDLAMGVGMDEVISTTLEAVVKEAGHIVFSGDRTYKTEEARYYINLIYDS